VAAGEREVLGAEVPGELLRMRRRRDPIARPGDDHDPRRGDRRAARERADDGVGALDRQMLLVLLGLRADEPSAVAREVGDRGERHQRDREGELGVDGREQRRRVAAEAHAHHPDARGAAPAEDAGQRAEVEHGLTEALDRDAGIAAGKERARASGSATPSVSRQHGERDVEAPPEQGPHRPEALFEFHLPAEVAVHDHDRRPPRPGDPVDPRGRATAVAVGGPALGQLGQEGVELALPGDVDDLAAASERADRASLDGWTPRRGEQALVGMSGIGAVDRVQCFHACPVTERLGLGGAARRLSASQRGAVEEVVHTGGEPLHGSGQEARHRAQC
jgi:hypothetical protein